MKRLTSLGLLMLLLLAGTVAISSAQTVTATGTVTTWRLNVRTAPSISATRLGVLNMGYSAGVIGRNSDASWYQLILPGGSGWVSADYLHVTNAGTVSITYNNGSGNPVVAGGLVNTGRLNIRNVPGATNNIPITSVPRNTPLTIFGRNTDKSWFKVTTSNNIQGWVRSRYVAVTSGDINALPIITENSPAPVPAARGYVNTGALNIRNIPMATNNVPITFVYRNTAMDIIGRTADARWYQVNLNGTVGWVHSRYIIVTSGNALALPITG